MSDPVNVSSPLCAFCKDAFGSSFANLHQHLTCEVCGKVFWKIPAGSSVVFAAYVVYTPGKIFQEAKRSPYNRTWKIRPLTWQRGRKDGEDVVYFPCGECGRILRTSASDINLENVICQINTYGLSQYTYVKCDHCTCHMWPYFEGFNESRKDMIESMEAR